MSGKKLRLDKYLADMSIGTRSEVKAMIRRGQVTVDGQIVKNADLKVGPENEVVCAGACVNYVQKEYYMLHKPAGVISATEDKKTKTVLDLIHSKKRRDLFPVGRLDKDTEGLLIITNDGALAHMLLSPKKHVPKVYYAKIAGRADSGDIEKFKDGIEIDADFTALPANLKILSVSGEGENTVSEIEVEIFEGKYHQVKRMFEAAGKPVIYLKRLSMGPLELDRALACGDYRPLKKEEIQALKQCLNTTEESDV